MKLKKVGCLLAAGLMLVSLAACGGSGSDTESQGSSADGSMDFEGRTLVVANWQDYATDSDYGEQVFEEMYNCNVEHYYINSYPELLQTMQNGGSDDIDVININPMYIQEFYNQGMIEPVDTSAVSNYADLRTDLADIDDVKTEDGDILGVPWVWGTTSLFYNADEVDGSQITSWSDLWDSEYAGKVAFFDDYTNCIMIAALTLGEDPYNPDLDAVKDQLMSLKSNIRTVWSTYDDFMNAYNNGQVVIGNTWGSMAIQLKAEGANIEYIYPEEGTIGWCDYWCTVADSEENDMALAWIDFCTSPDFQNNMATGQDQVYAPANQAVLDELSDETLQNLWIYPSAPENMYMSLYMDSDTLAAWSDLWTEVLASN